MRPITTKLIAFCCAVGSLLAIAHAQTAPAKHVLLTNRIGPRDSELFLANADGTGERKLFPKSQFDYDASFSADGKWIVFTSERSGWANLYRAHPDGTGVERLTDDIGFDDQAALSPRGEQLAFVSTRDGGSLNVWTLDLKTRKLQNLTHIVPPNGAFRPAWSPDGQWLVYSSDCGTESDRGAKLDHSAGRWEHIEAASLYLIHPDGTGQRRLTLPGKFAGSPKWSPDGKRVVFYELPVEDTFLARGFGNPASQIVSVDVETGARTEHTSGAGLKISPQILPDGRIGYLRKSPSESAGIAFTDGQMGAAGLMRNPAWSPDGKQVVYQKYIFPQIQNEPIFSADPSFEIHFSGEFPAISPTRKLAMSSFGDISGSHGKGFDKVKIDVGDLDGAHLQAIPTSDGPSAFSPSWSPDSQWVAFGLGHYFLERATMPGQIFIAHPDGSALQQLTSGSLNNGFPSFSPDGKHIVYRIWGQGELGLRILNLDDHSITNLTSGQDDNFPFWSPAGDRICFTRGGGKNAFDIFTIHPDGTGLTQLTDAPGNDAHCAWSPDARQIIFSSSRLGFRDEAPLYDHSPQPYAELFLMNADGSDQRPITNDKWEEGTPAWAPEPSPAPKVTAKQ